MSKRVICLAMHPLFIIITIVFAWCWVYGIGSWSDLEVPNSYAGDGISAYALIKAFASGEIYPGLLKYVGTLNAPFHANWNDIPFEDFIYFPAAILASIFGLAAGTWLYLLGIQVLAGLSFYLATRLMGLEKTISTVCAVLFALSPCAFFRQVSHLTITVYWHIPLVLVTLLWSIDPAKVHLSERNGLVLGIVAGLLAGIYNPYYGFIFLFLLAIILAGVLSRRDWRHGRRVTVVFGVGVLGFFLTNADTLLFNLIYGKTTAIHRSVWEQVTWGLRLPDLVIPPGSRFEAINAISKIYHGNYPIPYRGEAQWAYVGLVALLGLTWLVASGTVRLAARAFDRVSELYWIALFPYHSNFGHFFTGLPLVGKLPI
ncbi:MAG: hypothetical protein PHE55_01890 [Methylococcaceae bacterium]|nr:hypothetical protein [Methylococcaceae bacterium]